MTSSDMKKWLLKGSIPDINYVLPAGVDMKLAILAGLNICDDEELESVGAKFGLFRKAGPIHWEGNIAFGSRIVDMVAQEVVQHRSRASGMMASMDPDWGSIPVCIHKWKKYVGILDAFEYCEHCDEKKR